MLSWQSLKGRLNGRNPIAADVVDYRATSATFTDIYDRNVWGKGSGASSPGVTQPYMRMLVDFMRDFEKRHG